MSILIHRKNYFLLCLYGCNWDEEGEGDPKLPDALNSLLLWEVYFQITFTWTIGKTSLHLKRYFPENANMAKWPQRSVKQEVD